MSGTSQVACPTPTNVSSRRKGGFVRQRRRPSSAEIGGESAPGRRGRGMTRSLRIALLHLAPELGALDANRALIESGTRIAAGFGADLVVSGELVVPGYRFAPVLGTEWINEQPDKWMRRLARLSGDLGVVSFVSHPHRVARLCRRLYRTAGSPPAGRRGAAAPLDRCVVARRMGSQW